MGLRRGSTGIWCKVSGQNRATYEQLDGTCSESFVGSTHMPKTENWLGGGPEIVAIYGRRIRGEVTSPTTFVRLRSCVSSTRDSREYLA